MYLFEDKKLSEDDIIRKIRKNPLYDSLYYKSGVLQLDAFKKIPLNNLSSYYFERQEDKYTIPIYKAARKLSGKANDNWNPADVWMID